MRLKEIKPGMVIHCETKEEIEQFIKYIGADDYWLGYPIRVSAACYEMEDATTIKEWGTEKWLLSSGYNITKFSDLIIPPLSTEEVLETFGTICSEYYEAECEGCPMRKDDECVFDRLSNPNTAKEVVEICEQWRADHEKKEPAIEWTWHVEVHDDKHLYTGSYKTEGEARAVIEEKVKNNIGAYGRYERICRVKQQEHV